MLGATLTTGFGFASSIGMQIAPTLAFYHRYLLSKNVALVTEPSFSFSYVTKGRDPFTWSGGIGVGPMFQVTDRIALLPQVRVDVSYGYSFTNFGDNSIKPAKTTRTVVPLSFSFLWNLGRQWDLDASYDYHQIGYTQGFVSHVGLITLTHFW